MPETTDPKPETPAPPSGAAGGEAPRADAPRPEAPRPRPRSDDRGERGPGRGPRGEGRGREGGRRFFRRRKVCKFCVEKAEHIDYKEAKALGPFLSDRAKILPRRITGVCGPHQQQLKLAIQRARNIALLPFGVAL